MSNGRRGTKTRKVRNYKTAKNVTKAPKTPSKRQQRTLASKGGAGTSIGRSRPMSTVSSGRARKPQYSKKGDWHIFHDGSSRPTGPRKTRTEVKPYTNWH